MYRVIVDPGTGVASYVDAKEIIPGQQNVLSTFVEELPPEVQPNESDRIYLEKHVFS